MSGTTRPLRVLLALCAATALGLALAGPALANHGITTTAAVTMRGTPSNDSTGYGTVPSKTSPTYLCWTRGDAVHGLTVWFLVNYHGHTGFIPSYYDNSHYGSANDIPGKYGIPTCSTSGHGIATTATVTMRGTPHNADAAQGSVPKGKSPAYRCWARGDSVGGLTVWFLATYAGRTGFIPSHYDTSHYAKGSDIPGKYHVPSCGSTGSTPTGIGTYAHPASSTGSYPWAAAKCEYALDSTGRCPNSDWYWDENQDGRFSGGTSCDVPGRGSTECYDQWGYQYRNCTSYVAWRLAKAGRSGFSRLGNAVNWAGKGTAVTQPRAGDVAVFTDSTVGHVAYVEKVSGSTVTISDYNKHLYGRYWGPHALTKDHYGSPTYRRF